MGEAVDALREQTAVGGEGKFPVSTTQALYRLLVRSDSAAAQVPEQLGPTSRATGCGRSSRTAC
jgi:hypothetical protein